MKCNVQNASVSIKELQAKLTNDFKVTQDAEGNIQIYSNIEEYELNSEQVSLLIKDCDLTSDNNDVRWYLLDENQQHVHVNSIKKIGQEYTYVSYPKLYISYPSLESATEALKNLELHNSFGNLKHSFAIMESSKSRNFSEEKFYLTIDQNGYYDGQIYLSKGDGTETEIVYLTEKYCCHANGDIRRAVASIQQLNELANTLSLEGYSWHLKEVNRAEYIELANHSQKQEYIRLTTPIKKGKIGFTKNVVRNINKKYGAIYRELEVGWQDSLKKKAV